MKTFLMEFVGTFFLTLAVALMSANPLAVGLILMALVYIGKHISGALYNPTLVVTAWHRGVLRDKKLFLYLLSQILGSVISLLFVFYAFKVIFVHPMATEVHPAVVLVVEILCGFIFAWVYLSLPHIKDSSHITGIVIGLTWAALATLGGLFNPAIALGSTVLELLTGGPERANLWYLAIFVLGPLVGGFLATLANEYFND